MNIRFARLRLQDDVASCTRCALSAAGKQHPPIFPDGGPRLVILGDTPDSRGQRVVRRALHDAGVGSSEVAFLHTVCCPMSRPTDDHVAACRTHLAAALALTGDAPGVLLGGVALRAFRPDLRLTKVDRLTFQFAAPRFRATVLRHPGAVLRETDQGMIVEWRRQFGSAVAGLLDSGPDEPVTASRYCVECGILNQRGVDVFVVDRDGAGYCWRHRNKSKALSVDSKWKTHENKRLQETLL